MTDETEQPTGKEWYKSKTLWLNAIAFLAVVLQMNAGIGLTAEEQVGLLAVINLVLRLITTQGLK